MKMDARRFNGLDLLNKWRGKKVMFVGDSLSLNQWESLACLLHASVPNSKTAFLHRDILTSLSFQVLFFYIYIFFLGHCYMLLFFYFLSHVFEYSIYPTYPIINVII